MEKSKTSYANILLVGVLAFLSWFCIPSSYAGFPSPVLPNLLYSLLLPTTIYAYAALRLRRGHAGSWLSESKNHAAQKLYWAGCILSAVLFCCTLALLILVRLQPDTPAWPLFKPLMTLSITLWLCCWWCGYFLKTTCGESDYWGGYLFAGGIAFLNGLNLYFHSLDATFPSLADLLGIFMLPVYLGLAAAIVLSFKKKS